MIRGRILHAQLLIVVDSTSISREDELTGIAITVGLTQKVAFNTLMKFGSSLGCGICVNTLEYAGWLGTSNNHHATASKVLCYAILVSIYHSLVKNGHQYHY